MSWPTSGATWVTAGFKGVALESDEYAHCQRPGAKLKEKKTCDAHRPQPAHSPIGGGNKSQRSQRSRRHNSRPLRRATKARTLPLNCGIEIDTTIVSRLICRRAAILLVKLSFHYRVIPAVPSERGSGNVSVNLEPATVVRVTVIPVLLKSPDARIIHGRQQYHTDVDPQ
jgi:hypothetical protein